MAKERQLL